MRSTLCHYTSTTGHARQSPRSEVGDEVIAMLTPLLAPGEHAMPGPPGYRLRVTRDRGVLAATVTRASDGAPLATAYVCAEAAGLAEALRVTGCVPAVELTLPCALVEVHPALASDKGAIGWIGDFERCLAWAFLESSS